jgi:hypothetical protein
MRNTLKAAFVGIFLSLLVGVFLMLAGHGDCQEAPGPIKVKIATKTVTFINTCAWRPFGGSKRVKAKGFQTLILFVRANPRWHFLVEVSINGKDWKVQADSDDYDFKDPIVIPILGPYYRINVRGIIDNKCIRVKGYLT